MWLLPALPPDLPEPSPSVTAPVSAPLSVQVVPPPTPAPVQDAQPQPKADRQKLEIAGKIVLEADSIEHDAETQKYICTGSVRATYGVSYLEANQLVIDLAAEEFTASGETVLFDPEGIVRADTLFFAYGSGRGETTEATLWIGSVRLTAAKITIVPGVPNPRTGIQTGPIYQLENVTAQMSEVSGLPTGISAASVTVFPGKRAVMRRTFFTILGQSLGPFPETRFNLDQRVSGLKLPSIADRRGVGFGVTWDSSFLLNDRTGIRAAYSAFPTLAPTTELQLTHSPVDPGRNPHSLAPRDDLKERAADGWFTNVQNADPLRELELTRAVRNSYSIGTFWNVQTFGRTVEANDVSKLAEVAYESGGEFGPLGVWGTAKVHRIRPDSNSPWTDRANLIGTVSGPKFDINDRWWIQSRLDMSLYASNANQYGFLRGEVGMIGTVGDGLTLGAALATGTEYGTPDFEFDRLGRHNTFNLRADYSRGPYTVRVLMKYDFGSSSWYDTEYELALAAGSFEPYIRRREEPSDFRIGIRFRIGEFLDKIQQREFKRSDNRPQR